MFLWIVISSLILTTQDLVPVSTKHQVPLEYHGLIIGAQGKDIRSMMEEYDVSFTVPPPEAQLDTITITGTAKNCEEAKEALMRRVKQLDAEKEERVCMCVCVCVCVCCK